MKFIKNKKISALLSVLSAALLYFFLVIISGSDSFCYIKIVTGIPCPGCGMTRALFSFLSLEFSKAFFYHPLFPLVLIFPFMFIFRKNRLVNRINKNSKFWQAILVLFVSLWLIRMVLFFPDTPPFDFGKDSVVSGIISLIRP